jgi:hypothetical protein
VSRESGGGDPETAGEPDIAARAADGGLARLAGTCNVVPRITPRLPERAR